MCEAMFQNTFLKKFDPFTSLKRNFDFKITTKILQLSKTGNTVFFFFRGKVATVSPRAVRQLEGLNGPTYRLNDKLHPLPPPNALKVNA